MQKNYSDTHFFHNYAYLSYKTLLGYQLFHYCIGVNLFQMCLSLSCKLKFSVTSRLTLKGKIGLAGFTPWLAWILHLSPLPPVVPVTIQASITAWSGCVWFSPATFLQSHNSSAKWALTASKLHFSELYHNWLIFHNSYVTKLMAIKWSKYCFIT